jgi:uncharacterized RmlC-like cupin family protein
VIRDGLWAARCVGQAWAADRGSRSPNLHDQPAGGSTSGAGDGSAMDSVKIVTAAEIAGADKSGGISRRTAIDEPTLWAGISIVPAGSSTGWHHHGSNTTVFYMLSGSLIVEHGNEELAIASAGDFVVVPAGVEHREIVPGDAAVEAVVMRFGEGEGPLVVDVDRGDD